MLRVSWVLAAVCASSMVLGEAPVVAASCDIPTVGNFYTLDWNGTLAQDGLVRLTFLGTVQATDHAWVRIRNERTTVWAGELQDYFGPNDFADVAVAPGHELYFNVGSHSPGATYVLQRLDAETDKWFQEDVQMMRAQTTFLPEPDCTPYSTATSSCDGAEWCVIESVARCNAAAQFLGLPDSAARWEASSSTKPPGCRAQKRDAGVRLLFNPHVASTATMDSNQLAVCKRCGTDDDADYADDDGHTTVMPLALRA
jgi:hypothetical protein